MDNVEPFNVRVNHLPKNSSTEILRVPETLTKSVFCGNLKLFYLYKSAYSITGSMNDANDIVVDFTPQELFFWFLFTYCTGSKNIPSSTYQLTLNLFIDITRFLLSSPQNQNNNSNIIPYAFRPHLTEFFTVFDELLLSTTG